MVAASVEAASGKGKKIPVGLELYSVRTELKDDPQGTIKAVAKAGYEGVEFYAPYYDWTPEQAKETRKLLDGLGIRCFSTHNSPKSFTPEGIGKAMELNQIIGSKFIVMASAGNVTTLDGWKGVAETLTKGAEKMKPGGLRAGYHNHELEFTPIEGKRPMEVIAANTPKDVMLQLDTGPCVEMGSDPVAWINQNPGRIRSLHLKDWSKDKGYKVLFGEGSVNWKPLLEAAIKTGGAEYFLIEQEGSRLPPIETVQKCLENYRKIKL
jgi:sugar phosphate isomerase/epimerase